VGSLAEQEEHDDFSFREFEAIIERLLSGKDITRNP